MNTRMLDEAREAPAVVARQLAEGSHIYREFATRLRADPTGAILTIARGSSDHAAQYMSYLMMARLGRLVTSLPMSLVTLYQSKIRCDGLISLAFSQSGQSPDLIEPTQFFTENGATTAAFVNDPLSPLARAAQWVFPLHAGREASVAATKSFIAQLVAGARLVAAWEENASLKASIALLPEILNRAALQDWSPAVAALENVDRMFVIGRGTGLAVAQEAALKFKETCAIQAEAFSGAEIKHGPMALIEEGYPLLIFAPKGPAHAGLLNLADDMRHRGANVLLAAPPGTPNCTLPIVDTSADDLAPISMIQSFYPMVEALARQRGFDPDRPRHLSKVTRTH